MNFRLTTHNLDSMYDHPHIRPLAEDQAKSERSYALPLPCGSAEATRACLRSGLEISWYEGVLTKPLAMRIQTEYPHLEISYTISGYGTWSGDGAARCEMAPGVSTLLYLEKCRVDAELSSAAPLSHMEVRIDLRRYETLGEELRRLSGGGMYARQLAAQPQVAKLFEQLRDCPYTGPLRPLYLEGKCYELLASHLAQAGTGEAAGRARLKLSSDDIRCLHRARELLHDSFRKPPSLLALARSVGLNDFKLKRGFKELFGTTVFGYIRHLRMSEARRLLEEGEVNVSQAAVSVGYRNLSHFASAYRQTFGYNPSECLRGDRGPLLTHR